MGGYRLVDVEKRYADRLVLDIPGLDIRPGELLSVVGPSGAGKSTLLRLLHYLEAPTTGTITYSQSGDPFEWSGFPAPLRIRRRIGMVFQRPETVHGSVRENVDLGLRFRGIDDPRRVDAALARVEMMHLSDGYVGDLSGGELQRVALARVLAVQPDIALFDEPTANLDPANVAIVEAIIREMSANGTTVVLVTHNVFQARRLANRVALLLNGKLIEASPAEKFFTEPDDPRSLAFVRGEMVY